MLINHRIIEMCNAADEGGVPSILDNKCIHIFVMSCFLLYNEIHRPNGLNPIYHEGNGSSGFNTKCKIVYNVDPKKTVCVNVGVITTLLFCEN